MKGKRIKAIARRRKKRGARIRIRQASPKSSPTKRGPKQQRRIRISRGSRSKSGNKSARVIRIKRSARKTKRIRVKRISTLGSRKLSFQSATHVKALAALGLMRRNGVSLAKAIRSEHIKQTTFLRHVGDAVYRNGPGKPWKARKSDDLKAVMQIYTTNGRVSDVVRGLSERRLNARHRVAVHALLGGEDGAIEVLKQFEGLSVGKHPLVTDPNVITQMEKDGEQEDFDAFYTSVGSKS